MVKHSSSLANEQESLTKSDKLILKHISASDFLVLHKLMMKIPQSTIQKIGELSLNDKKNSKLDSSETAQFERAKQIRSQKEKLTAENNFEFDNGDEILEPETMEEMIQQKIDHYQETVIDKKDIEKYYLPKFKKIYTDDEEISKWILNRKENNSEDANEYITGFQKADNPGKKALAYYAFAVDKLRQQDGINSNFFTAGFDCTKKTYIDGFRKFLADKMALFRKNNFPIHKVAILKLIQIHFGGLPLQCKQREASFMSLFLVYCGMLYKMINKVSPYVEPAKSGDSKADWFFDLEERANKDGKKKEQEKVQSNWLNVTNND